VTNRRILVIDDDPPILTMVRDILEEEGFSISTAVNGKEGLNQIARAQPDLILCDERMPGLAGHEVCAQLYADPASRSIPVIIMSAHSYELAPTPPNCLLFLRKPFQYLDLMHAISDILGDSDRRAAS
jgi:CheY-like chemotaxis protein